MYTLFLTVYLRVIRSRLLFQGIVGYSIVLFCLIGLQVYMQFVNAFSNRPIEVLYDLRFTSVVVAQLFSFIGCLLFAYKLGFIFPKRFKHISPNEILLFSCSESFVVICEIKSFIDDSTVNNTHWSLEWENQENVNKIRQLSEKILTLRWTDLMCWRFIVKNAISISFLESFDVVTSRQVTTILPSTNKIIINQYVKYDCLSYQNPCQRSRCSEKNTSP